MKKHIDTFKEWELKENLEIVNQREINIDLFDNELTKREAWKLGNWSGKRRFDNNEIKKLSLYFGTYKPIYNDFDFNLNFGGFGREKINFKGTITKYSEYDDEGKKMINDYFLIKGYIKVNLGDDKGEREINIKLKSLQDVINFFDNFKDNIKIKI